MCAAILYSNKETNRNKVTSVHDKYSMNDKSETQSDLFLVNYKDKTYDVGKFLKHHPGGSKIVKAYRGLSLDNILKQTTHSKAAYHLLEDFLINNQRDYNDVEQLIDWDSPLLSQVGSLGDNYWKWVNLPLSRPIRLFESNILEYCSMTPWYIIPVIWIPIILYTLYIGYSDDVTESIASSAHEIILAFLWGICQWTFMEYIVHKKLFHFKPPSNSKTLITMHFLLHGVHHKAPFDDRRLLFPPIPALFLGYIIYRLHKVIFPRYMLHFTVAGLMTGYLCYDLTHLYLHQGAPKAGSYFYTMKRYHNYHHFSHNHLGFGISTRFWDIVFKTTIQLKKLLNAIEW